jgi:hypothetical protein
LTTLAFEIIWTRKITFEFLTFEIQKFQMTSDREMTETKVADLDDIYNFAIENFFI